MRTICLSMLVVIALCVAALSQSQCVILKRMNPADRESSALYSVPGLVDAASKGLLRGKQFEYMEGTFPNGMKFRSRLSDHDVREIIHKGGRVAFVDTYYTPDDLTAARDSCKMAAAQPEQSPTAKTHATESSKAANR